MPNHHVRAYTISTTLADLLTSPTSWRILSSHRHACNLINAQDELLALVTPTHGSGPFHVVISLPTLPALSVGAPALVSTQRLGLPGLEVDLSNCARWSPQLIACQAPSTIYLFSLWEISRSYPSPLLAQPPDSPLGRLAGPALQQLANGLADLAQLAAGAQQLAGLGPGLTPAGDDFLVGWLAGLWLWGESAGLPTAAISAAIGAATAPRTTRLSAAWLDHAAAGRFGEPWHGLAAALAQGSDRALGRAALRICATGATSGRDALAGLVWFWRGLVRSGRSGLRLEPRL